MQDAPFAEVSRNQSNADQRYQEGPERKGQWTMFGIPLGLKDCFFLTATTINENVPVRKQTFILIL